jgi:hypothetical protein
MDHHEFMTVLLPRRCWMTSSAEAAGKPQRNTMYAFLYATLASMTTISSWATVRYPPTVSPPRR